jgi:hypothetical protein
MASFGSLGSNLSQAQYWAHRRLKNFLFSFLFVLVLFIKFLLYLKYQLYEFIVKFNIKILKGSSTYDDTIFLFLICGEALQILKTWKIFSPPFRKISPLFPHFKFASWLISLRISRNFKIYFDKVLVNLILYLLICGSTRSDEPGSGN